MKLNKSESNRILSYNTIIFNDIMHIFSDLTLTKVIGVCKKVGEEFQMNFFNGKAPDGIKSFSTVGRPDDRDKNKINVYGVYLVFR